ncbi:MAG: SDR family oxidoreductase [Candidatus Omnitrophica bacterium]|nr:SDR family oxidoreductase [Candidatus Omnitrophota bacterium]MDD5352376.1 SDR family oxidoreductase [Candidatus Omnitrophota bacterium]MDD5549974.1 SDR family oxidoreductase [Candidatus Omnitrophota bacterium]
MDYTKKILIVGATGLIGKAVAEELGGYYQWLGTYFSKKSRGMTPLDIANKERIKEIFDTESPTHVVYCVNLVGGVDFCEKNPGSARTFHFEGAVNIARECLKHNSRFVFISSECVFDGKKEVYEEKDKVNPLNIYGKCKAEAERWIQDNLKDYLIARTMSVYGWDPKTKAPNAVMNAYFTTLKGDKVLIPTFRWSNPTYVKDLAKALIELCLSKESGIFHICGATFINRYEWLKKTFKFLGWDSSLILPQESIPKNIVLRPHRISLNTDKFRNKFKTRLHNLEEALGMLKEDILMENTICKVH